MVLVNGAEGIGTGWSTKIHNHDPREIIANIRRMMKGEEPIPMVSYMALIMKIYLKKILFVIKVAVTFIGPTLL